MLHHLHISRIEECLHSGEVSEGEMAALLDTQAHWTFCSIDGIHRILVATAEGSLYVGNVDPRDGGECRIAKEFRLFGQAPGDIHQEEERNVSNNHMLGINLIFMG